MWPAVAAADCGKGSGSAFANGTLIRVDVFEPAKKEPATLSDVFPPGATDNGAAANIKAEMGSVAATTATMTTTAVDSSTAVGGGTTSTTVSFSSVSGLDNDDDKSPERQQAALRRRFLSYLRNQGYDIQAGRGSLIISRQPRATLFSADASSGLEPSSSSEAPQPLICMPCKPATTSIGGMIGGSFCMPAGKN